MVRKMAAINFYIRGLNPHNIQQGDSLAKFNHIEDKESKSIVIANPPFGAECDQEAYPEVWSEYSRESKTTILFVKLMFEHLKKGGTCATIVSEGFHSWDQFSAKALRKMLLDEADLKAVISLPQGVFVSKNGQGPKTSILLFEKGKPAENVWFFKVTNDGYTMGTNRKQTAGCQLVECLDLYHNYIKHGKQPPVSTHSFLIPAKWIKLLIRVSKKKLGKKHGAVIGAVELFKDISELEHLKERINKKRTLDEIVSMNPHMQQIIGLLPNIAESDCNVLIQGSSGSGKELFAQVIHNLSSRKYVPYIKINCAALPAQLLESELFGYEKGAFTDARHDKPGQFCLANGGTLLLDEISEMDISLQVKLLRVLNNGEYRPLGSSKTLYSDARIIAATNSDLKHDIKRNKFREDLYYRINVMNIKIPPLKDRPEDIPLLVNHFIKSYKRKNRNIVERISPEALRILMKYSFPGNVRELGNVIQHTFVMCRKGVILHEHLPESVHDENVISTDISYNLKNQRELIVESLKRNNGNKSKAAVELGMHRSTLWRKIKGLQVDI